MEPFAANSYTPAVTRYSLKSCCQFKTFNISPHFSVTKLKQPPTLTHLWTWPNHARTPKRNSQPRQLAHRSRAWTGTTRRLRLQTRGRRRARRFDGQWVLLQFRHRRVGRGSGRSLGVRRLRRRPMRGLESPAASRGCIRVDRIGSGREELGRMEGIGEEGGEWGPRLTVCLRLALGFLGFRGQSE